MSEPIRNCPQPIIPENGMLFSNRGKLLVALVVLIGAFGYLAVMAFQSATVYYYTVGELQDLGGVSDGKMVRVSGKLVEDSFERQDLSTLAHFSLTDGSKILQAAHDGILPDLFFNEHSEIILEGTFRQDGVFESRNVIVKCPSKYVAVEENG